MSGITFLSENLYKIADVEITEGTENLQFPLSNMKVDSTTYKFRSTGDTVKLVLDLKQTRTIDTIAVVGDSIEGLQITSLKVKTSVTDDFSMSPEIDVPLSAKHNMGYKFIDSVSHRFVELSFDGNGEYAEIANVFIGERIHLPYNSFSVASFRYRNDDRSDARYNKYGQKFVDIYNFTKRLVGTMDYCTRDEMEVLDEMFLAHGRHSPLWVIIDPDSAAIAEGEYKLTMYGYLEKMPTWTTAGAQIYNCSLELDEVI